MQVKVIIELSLHGALFFSLLKISYLTAKHVINSDSKTTALFVCRLQILILASSIELFERLVLIAVHW